MLDVNNNAYGITFPLTGPDSLYEKKKAIRELLAKKVSPEGKGYTWTMGYNNCVGRCSGGRPYGKFSGSAFNRWRKYKWSYYAKDLDTITIALFTLAAQKAALMRKKYGGIPSPIRDLIKCPDQANTDGYRDWLRSKICGDGLPTSFGIHILSPRSRGKIKDKATAFYRACPGSRTFVTLTFINAVTDQTGVSILNNFLTVLRQRLGNVQYLWVAERQTQNEKYPNNVHFHLIINKRLPVKQYNALWVLQQYNAGLTGDNKYGEAISRAEIDSRYADGTIQKVLNPFDAKKIRGINGLSNYLTKYITKQEQDVPFGCAVWHCSRRVSRCFTRATVAPSAFRYMQSLANCRVDFKTGELFEAVPIKGDPERGGSFFTMIYAINKSAPLRYLPEMERINEWILGDMVPDRLPMVDDESYQHDYLREDGVYNKVVTWMPNIKLS